jgi:outer membrane protein W
MLSRGIEPDAQRTHRQRRIVMMNGQWLERLKRAVIVAVAAGVLTPTVANAQVVRVTRNDARNAIGFNLGYFVVRGEDSRVEEDVLLADLSSLLFEINDFNGFTFGGEWLFTLNEYIEGGVGLGFYQKTVPSVYRDFQDNDGSEIAQDLKLRIVPITATARFLPIGRRGPVEPFIGAGIGIFNWRYSETGEFVDFSDGTIFRDRFAASGNAVGPVVLAGVRAPVGDTILVGGEIRWQKAEGDTSKELGLLGTKIDLGGWTTSFTMHFRF